MSPYKKCIASVKEYFESVSALKFLLSAYIFIFAGGGVLFLLGQFIWGISNSFTTLGTILMLAGLILTMLQNDMMALAITSASISLISLIAWIVRLIQVGSLGAYSGYASIVLGDSAFMFSALFYFLAFGAIALLVFLKSEKFREMRAASATKSFAGIACPRCGGLIPASAAFCPQCGAPNPGPAQYAPSAPPQYAPQYAPQAAPQYAPPVPPQYAPPVAPQYAPQPQPAPQAPVMAEPAVSESPAAEPAPATFACKTCGTPLPSGAAFCGKCGTRQ